jgi:hypothetical protein
MWSKFSKFSLAYNFRLIQQLHDIEEIKKLKARYFRLVDTQQWAEWGQLFTSDAVFHGHAGEICGRDEIVSYCSGRLANALTVHHGYMPEIEILDRDEATGIWAMDDYNEWPTLRSLSESMDMGTTRRGI